MPTNHPTIPTAPSPRRAWFIVAIITASALVYARATAFALTDKPGDRITAGVIDSLAILAVGAFILAAVLGVGYDLARRAHQNALYFEQAIRGGVDDVRSDTGNIPKISDALAEMPTVPELITLVDDLAHQLRVIGERQKWLLQKNGLLPPEEPKGPEIEQLPEPVQGDVPEEFRKIVKRAFDTGRRIGRKEADG